MEIFTVKEFINKLETLDENKEIVFWSSGEGIQVHPMNLEEIDIEYNKIRDRYDVCV
ncbi:hypothetical protein [Enterococcus avium]|uniref:hypothetical protein n=1 Tax=Enterococcus avium TaxID=33945 RepID=UPI00288CC3B6|nr:hypothetical protein [Enterococcus avium]MDT2457514.1 hypothetical protein [Enterococcus avium]